MTRPRLLDLCCCAGGASVGYARAGFEVVGVDSEPQPRYPGTFIQADALTISLDGYDAYHVSPHCQHFSMASTFHPGTKERYPDQIAAFRARLQATGKPYIIENVAGAPLLRAVMLCGHMFGLRTYRHRYFESNMLLFQPEHRKHIVRAAGPGAIARDDQFWSVGGHFGQKDKAQRALGIDWMTTTHEIAQAIPPAYTDYLGAQLLYALRTTESGGAA